MGRKSYLRKNVGDIDSVIRIIVGTALIVWPPFAGWSPWSIAVLAGIGATQVHEGITRY